MKDKILMCKDTRVLNISTMEIYAPNLLPGILIDNTNEESFKTWIKSRYSKASNHIAVEMRKKVFGTATRDIINKDTFALSLTDCYWIKSPDTVVSFNEITPYANDFWIGDSPYKGKSIPTLYTPESGSCLWVSKEWLLKITDNYTEFECSRLCRFCEIPSTPMTVSTKTNGILVGNITNRDLFLERASQSIGLRNIDPTNDLDNIVNGLGISGFHMIILDSIFGNKSRTTSDFGFIRDANNGNYISMFPLYNFQDIRVGKLMEPDKQLDNLIRFTQKYKDTTYTRELLRISEIIHSLTRSNSFRIRSKYILDKMR